MSTRSSIKHEYDEDTGKGFHLYSDWLDHCVGSEVVHLQLSGISFEAEAGADCNSVTLALPRDMAERLGLLLPIVASP